jgi:hypothetical protein
MSAVITTTDGTSADSHEPAEVKNAINDELAGVSWALRGGREGRQRLGHLPHRHERRLLLGLDLRARRTTTAVAAEPVPRRVRLVSRFLLTTRRDCAKPVVAGINGVAVGAGLSLALAADIA